LTNEPPSIWRCSELAFMWLGLTTIAGSSPARNAALELENKLTDYI
jgi:hypothetical protein